MSRLRSFLCVPVFFFAAASFSAAEDAAKLRSQLALATGDDDTLARIELLRRLVAADPADAASHRLLVDLWLKIKDYDLAEATLQAWPQAPADLVALARAEILRQRDDDVSGAIRVLRDYLAAAPRNLTAHEALVDALLATDDTAAQLAALDALLALRPGDSDALVRRARVKFRRADYPGALADAKKAQALAPDSAAVKDSLPGFERLEEALQALPPLDASLARNPKNPAKLVERAWWLRYAGILDRSLADSEAALALAPDSLAAKLTRARALRLLGKLKAEDALRDDLVDVDKPHSLESILALAAADAALARAPENSAVLRRQRARALNQAEQYLLAKHEAEAVLALSPADSAAGLEALYAAAMLGQDPTAIFRRIEAMKPPPNRLALANAHVANFYFRNSNLPLALEFADHSLALAETESMLRVKAAALKRLNRLDEAAAAARRADALRKK